MNFVKNNKRLNGSGIGRQPGIPAAWWLILSLTFGASSLSATAADSIDFSIGLSAPQNTPEAVVGTALTQACQTAPPSSENALSYLRAVCNYIPASTPPTREQTAVLKEISAKVNTSTSLLVSRAPAIRFSGDIASRMAALRRSTQAGPLRTGFRTRLDSLPPVIPIFRAGPDTDAAGGIYSQRLSGFVNGNYASAEQRETTTEMGFASTGQGITAGIDYRIGPHSFLGVAPQLNTVSASLTDDGSALKGSQYAIVLYGTHFLTDAWYLEATVGRGTQKLQLDRRISFTAGPTTVQVTAEGETASAQTSLSLSTGSELALPYNATLSLSGNLVYAASSIDGYTEKNADSLNLTVAAQDVSSLTAQFIGSVSRAFSFRQGVLIPQLGATWLHEIKRDGERLQAQFAADTNATQFGFVTRQQDADYFILNADAQFLMPGGRVGFLRVSNVQLLRDRSETGVTLGFRMEF